VCCRADERFRQLSTVFSGLRVLRQDPLECLFSFLCSSNNNIVVRARRRHASCSDSSDSQRITLMLNNLCAAHGSPLGDVDGRAFHAFPSLERLCQLKEDDLRSMGFGYR
jgi:N-glycosylase/DNA lyase